MDSKWKWHNVIHHMITELNMKEQEVYEMNYISCLNWQGYFYERNKVRENIMKKNK